MNKESLQYRRIDKAILNAFIKISPKIPFEKMTVQDILDESLVSRYTFYVHFHDKYEVAERIQDNLYQQFLLLIEQRFPAIDSQTFPAPGHSSVNQEVLDFFRKNEPEIRAIDNIHTETIDFAKKIKNVLSTHYLNGNEKRPTLTLESLIYSGSLSALMEYTRIDSAWLSNMGQTIFEAHIRVMAYTIGLHDPKDIKKLLEITEKLLHQSQTR